MSTTINVIQMAHEEDPAGKIRGEVGDLSGFEVFHNWILIGLYERPEKTRGGIILTTGTKKEDRFQNKVGLVLKVGPGAFEDDTNNKFHGQSLNEGDFVMYRKSDGWETSVNGKICLMIEDACIKARVSHPDMVW